MYIISLSTSSSACCVGMLQKPSAPWGRPEDVLDLHGATLEMGTKDKLTSRKNVLVVSVLPPKPHSLHNKRLSNMPFFSEVAELNLK